MKLTKRQKLVMSTALFPLQNRRFATILSPQTDDAMAKLRLQMQIRMGIASEAARAAA